MSNVGWGFTDENHDLKQHVGNNALAVRCFLPPLYEAACLAHVRRPARPSEAPHLSICPRALAVLVRVLRLGLGLVGDGLGRPSPTRKASWKLVGHCRKVTLTMAWL